MNRRTFIASLFTIPAGVALTLKADAHVCSFSTDTKEHKLLNDCGNVVEPAPLDLDAIFERMYAVRSKEPQQIFWRNHDGSLYPLN